MFLHGIDLNKIYQFSHHETWYVIKITGF